MEGSFKQLIAIGFKMNHCLRTKFNMYTATFCMKTCINVSGLLKLHGVQQSGTCLYMIAIIHVKDKCTMI